MLAVRMKKAKTIKPLVSRSIAIQTTVRVQIFTREEHWDKYEKQGDLDILLEHSLNDLRDQVQEKWVSNMS